MEEQFDEWYASTREEVIQQSGNKPDSTYESIDINIQRRAKYYYSNNRLIRETFSDNKGNTLYEAIYAKKTNLRLVTEYCKHGHKIYEGIDYDNKPMGPCKWYDCKSGKISRQGSRVGFKKCGTWIMYDKHGNIAAQKTYEQDKNIVLPEV